MAFIYILSNVSMPGLLKIGYTTRTVQQRVQELNGATGVPTPFVIEAYFRSEAPEIHERRVHRALASHRAGKEFFRINVEGAKAKVAEVCQTDPEKEGWLSVVVAAAATTAKIVKFLRRVNRRL